MTKLKELVKFLDKELKTKKIPDISVNGLQVKIKNKQEIKKVGFAVDACLSTFEKAKKEKVDLLIVHHGIKWKPQKYIRVQKRRKTWLKKNKINLYAVHAPLDKNEKYGHNIGLSRLLGLKDLKRFGKFNRTYYGFAGKLKSPLEIKEISKIIEKRLKTKCRVFIFNNKKIFSMGIVSGSSGVAIEEAAKKKLDCFLLGEIRLGQLRQAQDLKLNLIVAGHYATETPGLILLKKLIENKFPIKTVFIDDVVNY